MSRVLLIRVAKIPNNNMWITPYRNEPYAISTKVSLYTHVDWLVFTLSCMDCQGPITVQSCYHRLWSDCLDVQVDFRLTLVHIRFIYIWSSSYINSSCNTYIRLNSLKSAWMSLQSWYNVRKICMHSKYSSLALDSLISLSLSNGAGLETYKRKTMKILFQIRSNNGGNYEEIFIFLCKYMSESSWCDSNNYHVKLNLTLHQTCNSCLSNVQT